MIRPLVILALLFLLLPEQSIAQNGQTVVEKQPVYSLELNQDDRDRMDELIVELRQLNTWLKQIKSNPEQEPRKQRRSRRKR